MKNHRGEIATLLTLGLVVVGTLITLGTSLFVSNKTTNLASNSKATMSCPSPKKIYTRTSQQTCSGVCTGIPGYAYDSQNMSTLECCCKPTGSAATAAQPAAAQPVGAGSCTLPWVNTSDARDECAPNGYTKVGCQTGFYKCTTPAVAVPAPVTSSFACATGEKKSGTSSQTCSAICGSAGYISNTQQLDGATRNCCCNKATAPAAPAASSGTSSYQCSEGEPISTSGTCFSTCEANGSTYVSNSQGTGVDGKHYCCCKKTESGKGFDTCYKAYTPGSYGCEAPSSKVVVYAPSMAAVGMDNCSKYNTNSNTSLYFAQAPGAYSDGQCAVVWSGALDVGAKSQEAQQLIEPPVEIPDETGDDIPGEEADNCIKRVGFKCSSGGYTGSTKTFDYYKSTAAGCTSNTVGGSCYGTSPTSCSTEWNVFLKSQCSSATGGGSNSCKSLTISCKDTTSTATGTRSYKKDENCNNKDKCFGFNDCSSFTSEEIMKLIYNSCELGVSPANEVSLAGNNVTFNPSSQCTNSECLDPNKGIFYSYKCASIPQTINGKTQCSSSSFYEGSNCINLRKDLNANNIQQAYCNADYPGNVSFSSDVKRPVTISYTVNQTGAINIDPSLPTITLNIQNNYGLGIFTKSFTIGTTSFPAPGSTTINTGTNVIKAYLSYQNSNKGTTTLPCQQVNVVNKKANITCDIK